MIARLTSVASLEASTVLRARVQIPAWGCWWCDVDLQDDLALDAGARVTITIADVDLVGAVVAGGAANGRAAYRVVAGAGGWSSSVPAAAYYDASGVSAAAVITDAAALVGETVDGVPTSRGGSHYARSEGSASRVLHDLCSRAWYVDLDGVTRFGARAAVTYSGGATRTVVDTRADMIALAVDELAGLVPGVVVDGLAAIDVEYELDKARLTVRVYGGPRSSRELDAFRRVLDALDPRRAYRCAYEYRVVTQSGHTLNLQPVRASAGMPDLERVPVRLAPGVRATHFLGSLVTVVFLDGDPSRPRVITGDDADAPGWMPLGLDLGEAPVLGVARVTDPVIAGPWAGTITAGSARVKAGL